MSESLPASLDLQYLCTRCVDIARTAGLEILRVYNSDYTIESKQDNTPLTDADIAAHNVIVNELNSLTPDIPVLSEESSKPSFDERQSWNTYWLVDPLDGTREFIKRNGEFTVNIALIHHHQSIVGVVHVPVLELDYFAWKHGGAYKQINRGDSQPIRARRLNGEQLVVAGSRSHGSEKMQSYLKHIGDYEMLSMGSSLKICLVAEGKVDIYPRLGPTSEWDTAAAHCIVEQAGGYLTSTDMSPLRYNTRDSLLNPHFLVYGDNSRDWSAYLKAGDDT